MSEKFDEIEELFIRKGLINSDGETLEDRVYRYFDEALEQDSFVEIQGIFYDSLNQNISGKFGQTVVRYNITLFNQNHILIVKVKRQAHVNDLEQLLKQKQTFPVVFPYFKDFKFHLGLASESFDASVVSEAQRYQIYLMQEKAGVIQIIAST